MPVQAYPVFVRQNALFLCGGYRGYVWEDGSLEVDCVTVVQQCERVPCY